MNNSVTACSALRWMYARRTVYKFGETWQFYRGGAIALDPAAENSVTLPPTLVLGRNTLPENEIHLRARQNWYVKGFATKSWSIYEVMEADESCPYLIRCRYLWATF